MDTDALLFARKQDCFNETFAAALKFVRCTVHNSSGEVVERSTLGWAEAAAQTFSFSLRPDVESELESLNCTVSREQNIVGRFCELVASIVICACEALVFENSISESAVEIFRDSATLCLVLASSFEGSFCTMRDM